MRGDECSGLILLKQIFKITPEYYDNQKEKDYNLLDERAWGTEGHSNTLKIKLSRKKRKFRVVLDVLLLGLESS